MFDSLWGEPYFGEVLRKMDLAALMYDDHGRISFCNAHLLEYRLPSTISAPGSHRSQRLLA
jgi:hypothetical protein